MELREALEALKLPENKDKKLHNERWWSSEYLYYKDGKFYQENGVLFNDERIGTELLTATERSKAYYLK